MDFFFCHLLIFHILVVGTSTDPIKGWCHNFLAINGLIAGTTVGLLRIMFGGAKCKGDIICADFVTNSTLVIASVVNSQR